MVSLQKKYKTKNPISRYLIKRFHNELIDMLPRRHECSSLLEVGCGEGRVLRLISDAYNCNVSLCGLDANSSRILHAQENNSGISFLVGNIYKLPFSDNRFDAILCTEVMEHLENPLEGLEELARVAKKHIILTVPNEPLWCILNIVRGAYWCKFGNTPGHINHWSTRQFVKFVASRLQVDDYRQSMPWTLLRATP